MRPPFYLLHSIRFRLAVWFVLILGLVMAGFCAFIYYQQTQDLRSIAVARLNAKSQRLLGFLRFAERVPFPFNPMQAPDSDYGEPILQETDSLALVTMDGKVVQSWGAINSEELTQRVIFPDVNKSIRTYFDVQVSPSHHTAFSRPWYVFETIAILHSGDPAGFLLIGSPVDPNGQLPRLALSLGGGLLLTLTLALLGGLWLAGRAMKPVKTITQTARMIGETDLSQRLRLDSRDEIGELANTFNGMLARLQAAFERQRQFTADASHELRTPLTIVELESSRVLEEDSSLEEYRQAMKVVRVENQFMIRMVNNLLTLARMDAGQVTLERERLDLSDVALEVVERLAPLAVKNEVHLATGELPELTVVGDPQYLAQMITNLVENAIKHSGGGGARVEVETGLGAAGGPKLAWVRVSDQGPGIPPEHLERIFDRYYQVDRARTRPEVTGEGGFPGAPTGTGLGLSIARWIAQAHGGKICVQSEVGKGSTFEVDIPLAG